jgi:hypothetical protein
MRQDKLDLVKALTTAPVLDGGSPTMTCVAKAVDKYHRGRMAGGGREQQRRSTADRHCVGTAKTLTRLIVGEDGIQA